MSKDITDSVGDIFDEIADKNKSDSNYVMPTGNNSLAETSNYGEDDFLAAVITADNDFSSQDASFLYLYAAGFSKRMAVMKAYAEYSDLSSAADKERFITSRTSHVLYNKKGNAIVDKIRQVNKRQQLQNDALVDKVLDGIADDLETTDDDRSKNIMRKMVLDYDLKNKELSKRDDDSKGDSYVIYGDMYKNNDNEKAINTIEAEAVEIGEEVAINDKR